MSKEELANIFRPQKINSWIKKRVYNIYLCQEKPADLTTELNLNISKQSKATHDHVCKKGKEEKLTKSTAGRFLNTARAHLDARLHECFLHAS